MWIEFDWIWNMKNRKQEHDSLNYFYMAYTRYYGYFQNFRERNPFYMAPEPDLRGFEIRSVFQERNHHVSRGMPVLHLNM